MPKTQQTPATDQATGAGEATMSALHPSSYHLALIPTDGNDWWNYTLTIDDLPAVDFRHGDRAILALEYAVDDMQDGVFATTDEYLDYLARGTLRPIQKPADEYRVRGGWN